MSTSDVILCLFFGVALVLLGLGVLGYLASAMREDGWPGFADACMGGVVALLGLGALVGGVALLLGAFGVLQIRDGHNDPCAYRIHHGKTSTLAYHHGHYLYGGRTVLCPG